MKLEKHKRRKAAKLVCAYLSQVLVNLIDSPMYEVLGNPWAVGKTMRVRKNVYKMPILCFSSATERLELVGLIIVNVETERILSCPTGEEVKKILVDFEKQVRLLTCNDE